MVFDLKADSSTEVTSTRVVHFYIGDHEECDETTLADANIRAVIEELADDEEQHVILLDLGADAPVFPASFLAAGILRDPHLHDAQRHEIPVLDMRNVEIRPLDMSGKNWFQSRRM